jgi:O-acetylhomoserine (thiol)-lyase
MSPAEARTSRGAADRSDVFGSVAAPIYQTSAYEFPSYAAARELFQLKRPGFTYSRTGNPTVAQLEARINGLEGGIGAVATASGQSAVALALLTLVRTGDHLVVSSHLYGGTVDFLTDTLGDLGITVSFAHPHRPDEWRAAAAAAENRTRAFFVESIANPLATVADLAGIAEAAHEAGVPLVVDNTVATPVLCRPFEHGADIVVHSATKFLGGHGTALAGAVVDSGAFDWSSVDSYPAITAPKARYGGDTLWGRHGKGAYLALLRSKFLHDLGPALAPASAAVILQGIETLDLRLGRQTASALAVARFLAQHPGVARVHHPGVETGLEGEAGRNAELAAQVCPDGVGSVFAFDLDVTAGAEWEQVERFIDALESFRLVANIGDTKSLVAHPAAMTHVRLTPAQREAGGISLGTIRLSVGLEPVEGLLEDLGQALSAAGVGQSTVGETTREEALA